VAVGSVGGAHSARCLNFTVLCIKGRKNLGFLTGTQSAIGCPALQGCRVDRGGGACQDSADTRAGGNTLWSNKKYKFNIKEI
jgi:hypothetical protein